MIPDGCVLMFNGGKLKNGTIQGNHTVIVAPDEQIFVTSPFRYKGYTLDGVEGVARKPTDTYLYITGTWNNEYVSTAWNGLDSISSEEDASQLILDYILLHKEGVGISLPSRVYGIYGSIRVYNRNFDANNSTFIFCDLSHIYGDDVDIPEGADILNRTYFKRGLPLVYNSIYIQGAGVLSNFTIDQSNVTNDDIDLNGQWGVYGLVGKWGTNKSIIKNVHIKNAFECGVIGISGETVFEDCTFDGSGEHEVYGRPAANIIFRRCKFTNWENNQTIATARGAAFAIKLIEGARNTNCSVTLEDCDFVKGNSLSTNTIEIEADNIYIKRCRTDFELAVLSCTPGRTLNVYIDKCEGIFYGYNTYGIFHISDSRGCVGCLYNACEIKNCTLYPDEMSIRDSREACQASMIDTIRTMTVDNCTFLVNDVVNGVIRITGVYNMVFRNVKFLYNGTPDGIGNIDIEVRPKADDTIPSGVSPKFLLDSCYANLGKRNVYFIVATKYDVTLKNTIFCGERNYASGYLNRLYAIYAAASLSILNSCCIPGKDNTVMSLYADGIPITRIDPSHFGQYAASNVGLQSFDYTNKKPIWWDGSGWVYADGSPVS